MGKTLVGRFCSLAVVYRWALGIVGLLFCGGLGAQTHLRNYANCPHDSLISVLRAYEDSLALASSMPVLRMDYTLRVTEVGVVGKEYRIYRCQALYDSLTALIDAVDFARATPPVVDTDSISGVTGTGATFHAKVTSDGGEAVTAQWFRYGTSAAGLVDSAAVAGTSTPFSASASTLSTGTTYYVAGFARNAKGTLSGDTLSFTTWAAPTVDTQAASSVTDTAATLNATFADGGSAVTATGFKYATNVALTGATDVAGSGTTSPFTGALTGLTLATQYWAVGYATNAVGTTYGDTISFTTLAAAPSLTCSVPSVTYDGHTYPTVMIGNQCWLSENLKNDDYNDGTPIPGNLADATWISTTTGAQAIYGEGVSAVNSGSGDEVANLGTYGRLYNWYAVNTGKLCPSGWHVPTDAEWDTLASVLGGGAVAGDKLKSTTQWAAGDGGTNTTGFSALPGGGRNRFGGYYIGEGTNGYWWSATPVGSNAGFRYMTAGDSQFYGSNFGLRSGFSVRCLQNTLTAPVVDTDAASSVTETAATLNATFTDGGSAVTATGFKVATNAALTGATDVTGSGTSSPFTGSLTGLTASTQYWAVGYATNAVGTSYGDTITFTTSPAAPAAPAAFTCGTSTVTYDGYSYATVLIGSQCWFQENLRNDSYNDGTSIAGNLNNTAWTTTTSGAQAIYGGDSLNNYAVYGRLYNGYAVNTGKLCPTGWHVPTDAEWDDLETYLGGAGAAVKLKVSSSHTPAWNGNNSSGFTALPGGGRNQGTGLYTLITDRGNWWSSTSSPSGNWNRYWSTSNSTPIRFDATLRFGFSVRCIED